MRVVPVTDGELLTTIVEEAVAARDGGFLTACVVADEAVGMVRDAFAAAGVVAGVPERDGIGRPITVVPATEAKGLEFDAVVVVEPAAIVGESAAGADVARGVRLLYVALTRPIQLLVVVHARPLPSPLAG